MSEKMTKEDWQQTVALMGSAPLQNMQHAQQVDALILKVMRHGGLVDDPDKQPPTPLPKRPARRKK